MLRKIRFCGFLLFCSGLILLLSSRVSGTVYYVNDDSTSGDLWCTQVGNDGNSGLATNLPKRNICSIFNSYTLTGGDEVRVDRGTYTDEVKFESGGCAENDNGSSGSYLVIRGAGITETKVDGGGSRWWCFKIVQRKGIMLRDMYINASSGGHENILVYSSTNCMVTNCRVYQALGTGNGITISDYSRHNKIIDCRVGDSADPNTQFGICVKAYGRHNTLFRNWVWNSDSAGIMIENGSASNTIMSNRIYENGNAGTGAEGINVRKSGTASPYSMILGNSIYLNDGEGIKLDDEADHTRIEGNRIYKNNNGNHDWKGGVGVHNSCDYAVIRNNAVYSNKREWNVCLEDCKGGIVVNNSVYSLWDTGDDEEVGIGLWSITNFTVSSNNVYGHTKHGIKMTDYAVRNTLECNRVCNNSQHGILLSTGSSDNRLFRNLSYNNGSEGFRIDNSSLRVSVINNTSFRNGKGILFDSNSTSCTLRNSIAASNANEGVQVAGSASVTNSYNDSFGNGGGNFVETSPGVFRTGPGNLTSDPLFQSTLPSATNFLFLSALSPCVDTGCPSDPVPPDGGLIVDRGAVEYLYSPDLTVSKSVTNVSRGGSGTRTLPGSSVTYRIFFTNAGLGRGINVVFFDGIKNNITFSTSTSLSGWTNQWSTNLLPDQAYDSADYKNAVPEKDKIKWVRWKIPVLPYYTAGVLYLKVVIK